MHYRNGRLAEFGDVVVMLEADSWTPRWIGILETCGSDPDRVGVRNSTIRYWGKVTDCVHLGDVEALIRAANSQSAWSESHAGKGS